MAMFFAQAAAAQVTTNYTTTASDTKKTFGLIDGQLDEAPLDSGPYDYFYVAVDMTPSANGSFTFGQTPVNYDNIMLVYKDAFDPTQPATNFFAFGTPEDSASVCPAGDANSACLTVTRNLTAGTKYIIVMTTYFSGSNLVTPITLTARGPGAVTFGAGATAPAAPTNLVATAGDKSVSLAFTAPADGGSAITGYEYELNGPSGVKWVAATQTTSPITITGLDNGVYYGFKLRAKNAIGTGPASTSVSATPDVPAATSKVTAAPTNLNALADDGSVVLDFDMTDENYATTVDYEYQLNGGAWAATGNFFVPIRITGLTNGTQYSIKVRGIDDMNVAGPASAPILVTPIASQVLTEFTTGPSDVVSQINLADTELGAAPTGLGNNTYDYYALKMTATEAGLYGFGQSGGTVDTVMAIYDGEFDPTAPTANLIGFNDDGQDVMSSCGGENYCPFAVVNLTAGQSVVMFISTFDTIENGSMLELPMDFFAKGPGEVTFESVAPITVAEVPTDLVATPSAGQVSVAFTAPADGGAEITDYEYQLNGGTWVTGATAASPVVITGLTNGTTYSVKLRAVNAIGNGPESAAVSATLPLPPVQGVSPAAPQFLAAKAGNGQVSISFTPGDPGWAAISDYKYQVGTGNWISAGTKTSPIVITGLTNGTAYNFRIRAVSSFGDGFQSDVVTATPVGSAGLVPDAPSDLVATPDAGTLALSFTGSNYSTTYNYDYQLDGGDWIRSTNGWTTSFTITGLTDGQPYSIKVRGVDKNGVPGPASDAITATPGAPPPPTSKVMSAPTDLLTSPDFGKLWLNFKVTSADSSVIYNYEYQIDDGAWVKAGTYRVPFVISGLTDGQEYSIKVRGLDSKGLAGPESAAVTGTPGAPPASLVTLAPTGIEVFPDHRKVRIGIRMVSADPEYAVTADREYQVNGGAWTKVGGTTSPFTISPLQNNVTYSVKVRGVDQYGRPGPESEAVSATPSATGGPRVSAVRYAPKDVVAIPSDGKATIFLTLDDWDMRNTYDYQYKLDDGAWVTVGDYTVPFTITGLTNGQTYNIAVRAVDWYQIPGPAAEPVSVTVNPQDHNLITTNYTSKPGAVTSRVGMIDSKLFVRPAGPGTNFFNYYAVKLTPEASGFHKFGQNSGALNTVMVVYDGEFDPAHPESNMLAYNDNGAVSTDYCGGWALCPVSLVNLTAGKPVTLVITSYGSDTDLPLPLGFFATGPAAVTFTAPPVVSVPDAPSDLVATAGDGQIELDYTPPANDGGAAITDYKYQLDGAGDWVSAGLSNPITITGLTNGQDYSITLRAVNAVGDGVVSVPANAMPVVTTNYTTGATDVKQTFGLVDGSLRSNAPTGAGDNVYSYVAVTMTPSQSGNYTFGRTESSSAQALTVYEGSFDPSQPEKNIIAFDAATNESDICTSYAAYGGPCAIVSGVALTAGTTYILVNTGADPGDTDTTFQLTAVGPASVTFGSAATTPDAPVNLVATAGNTQISVAYDAPANDGGSAIKRYEYQLGTGDWVSAELSNPIVIAGLTNGTEYSVKLRAVNVVGNGAVSDAVTGTPVTTPDAPTDLVATAGNAKLTVGFTAPINTGGAAITDYEYQLDGGNWVSAGTTSSPIDIAGLTNGTEYSVKLRAVTSVGAGAESAATTGTPVTTPDVPTDLVATAGNAKLTVGFTAPINTGGAAITDYEYQLDGGNWVSAGTTSSPIDIAGLTNGTEYSVKLRAVTSVGAGAESAATTGTPVTTPDAPTNLVATAGNAKLTVGFTAPINTGGAAITDYEYQLDGGNWVSAGTTSSPIDIAGLTNGTEYSVKLRAVTSVGAGAESAATTGTPVTTPDAPTDLVATPDVGQVSVAFTAPTNTGGTAITDYKYQLNGGTWVSAGSTSSPIVIVGLSNGTNYSIKLLAVNMVGDGAESAAVSADTPSPAAEFKKEEEVINEVVVEEASRSLQATVNFNEQMTRDARTRFITQQRRSLEGNNSSATAPANDNIAFDVDGMAEANGLTLSTRGKFFGQEGNANARRLVFGDFDLQHDGDTGSTTLSFTGRMAWEKMTSENTMLGVFIGGELTQSNIAGAFAGNHHRIGVIVGGYGAHSLSDKLFVDGYVSFGMGRNNLNLSNGILALNSEYVTRTTTFGGRLSGIIEKQGYEIWPELSFNYGRTSIGDVGFTGKAFGLIDNGLSLDADTVTTTNVMFRPEFRLPLDGQKASKSLKILTLAPRIICEQMQVKTTVNNCGGGAEIGVTARSEDGMTNVTAKLVADRIGNRTQSNLQLNLEFRF